MIAYSLFIAMLQALTQDLAKMDIHLSDAWLELGWRDNTLKSYTQDIKLFIYWLHRHQHDLFTCSSDLLKRYLKQFPGRHRLLSAIRPFQLINPALAQYSPICQRRFNVRLPVFFSQEEIEQLLQVIDPQTTLGQRDITIIELLYASGLRASELIQLEVSDIDFTHRRLWVNDGKGGHQRLAIMNEPAMAALQRYLQCSRPLLCALSSSRMKTLFLNYLGRPLTRSGLAAIVRKYADRARLNPHKAHPHALRHSFATHLLDGGANLRVIQQLLGHASIKSTTIYTHIAKKNLQALHRASHPRG